MYQRSLTVVLLTAIGCFILIPASLKSEDALRIAPFDVDATPKVGSPLAYDPMKEATEPLRCRGVVLLPDGQKPIVLCAVDWLGVANAAQDEFRGALAQATGTSPDRVVVHSLHQHDAPRCDLSAAEVLAEVGEVSQHYDVDFHRAVWKRAAKAAGEAMTRSHRVVSIGIGASRVNEVASNRRMLGPDGKVHTTRYTACRDPKIRALPEGVIDPWLRTLTFEGAQGPLAVVTFYATHPQSYYRTGQANPDFPGMARNTRQHDTSVFHLHFNGAGGNIGAGKYNDGALENRAVLADKVAQAMGEAYQAREVEPLQELRWEVKQVSLPVGEHLKRDHLEKTLHDPTVTPPGKLNAAKKLAFLERAEMGKQIPVSCLKVNENYLLFMPGELFVEYQLAGRAMREDANVLMAAYGEYGTGYIGTRAAYPQGGYEVSERASNVSPAVEMELVTAMRELLEAEQSRVLASDFTDTTGELPK